MVEFVNRKPRVLLVYSVPFACECLADCPETGSMVNNPFADCAEDHFDHPLPGRRLAELPNGCYATGEGSPRRGIPAMPMSRRPLPRGVGGHGCRTPHRRQNAAVGMVTLSNVTEEARSRA